jgi:hypothetical protein
LREGKSAKERRYTRKEAMARQFHRIIIAREVSFCAMIEYGFDGWFYFGESLA